MMHLLGDAAADARYLSQLTARGDQRAAQILAKHRRARLLHLGIAGAGGAGLVLGVAKRSPIVAGVGTAAAVRGLLDYFVPARHVALDVGLPLASGLLVWFFTRR